MGWRDSISNAVSQVSHAVQQAPGAGTVVAVRDKVDHAASAIPGYDQAKGVANTVLPVAGAFFPGAAIPLASTYLTKFSGVDQAASTGGQFADKVTLGGAPIALVNDGFRDSAIAAAENFLGSVVPASISNLIDTASSFFSGGDTGPSTSNQAASGGGFGQSDPTAGNPLLLILMAAIAALAGVYLLVRK